MRISFEEFLHDARYSAYLDERAEPSKKVVRIQWLWFTLMCMFWEAWCDQFGHDWEDTSEAGPESGDMSGYCKRCGYSHHHQLY